MFIQLQFYFLNFFLCSYLKFWLNVFHQANFDEWEHVLFSKNLIKQKVSNFAVYIIKFTLFNKFNKIILTVY